MPSDLFGESSKPVKSKRQWEMNDDAVVAKGVTHLSKSEPPEQKGE